MKNFLCFTTVSGSRREAEFARIEYIKPVHITGTNDYRYYSINITNVVYTDTGETDKDAQFGLFAPDDFVTYLGKTYEFGDLDRLCMVVENEKLKHVLDEL
jgi:hypothetical protein